MARARRARSRRRRTSISSAGTPDTGERHTSPLRARARAFGRSRGGGNRARFVAALGRGGNDEVLAGPPPAAQRCSKELGSLVGPGRCLEQPPRAPAQVGKVDATCLRLLGETLRKIERLIHD